MPDSQTAEIQSLEEQRRKVDERFDPRAALFAQTRYLLWMWQRYPGADWVYEAYHGGEHSVNRTVTSYLGPASSLYGSVSAAIRGVNRSGKRVSPPLTYAAVFFGTTPRTHPRCFRYLYSLKDEHRTYWFKLLMAERALAWFRRDPTGLRKEWELLRPGAPIEDAWYPAASEEAFESAAALGAGVRSGLLLPAGGHLPKPSTLGRLVGSATYPGDVAPAARPEVLGALTKVISTFATSSSAPGNIEIVCLSETRRAAEGIRSRFPPRAALLTTASTGEELHASGHAVSIRKPRDRDTSMLLEYALAYWEDRQRIHYRTEEWGDLRAWRIVPNPAYRDALASAVQAIH